MIIIKNSNRNNKEKNDKPKPVPNQDSSSEEAVYLPCKVLSPRPCIKSQ